jgi:antibiotic biosynthesis monooxygenase (ABM) superfamily enzyme
MAVWMRSWLLAFVLVGLAIYFVAPHVRRFVDRWP